MVGELKPFLLPPSMLTLLPRPRNWRVDDLGAGEAVITAEAVEDTLSAAFSPAILALAASAFCC